MHVRGTFPALALAALVALPTIASSAIVQKWQTPNGTGYILFSQIGDLNADSQYELLTGEFQAGGVVKVALRSGATGAILAQTAGTYLPTKFWIQNLDPSNGDRAEIIFSEASTGKLTCLSYTTGNSTLAVRWNYMPTPSGVPSKWAFADFDGTGNLYFFFKDESGGSTKYFVRDNNGTLQATFDLTTAPVGSGWSSSLFVNDYDLIGRSNVMVDYHYSGVPDQDVLYVFHSNVPGPGIESAAEGARSAHTHPRPAARTIEQVNGAWVESGPAESEARATQGAVRLP